MLKKIVIFLFLMFTFLNTYTIANEDIWTEKKLGKVILKADKAARQKKWNQAIKYGEQMLKGVQILDHHSDVRYIILLKNLNKYYDKAGRLREVSARIKNGYTLSKLNLGPTHDTSLTSRNLYYKLLISYKNYQDAIPLIYENISVLNTSKEDSFRKLHYLEQLVHLYGLTREFEKEENTLHKFIELNETLFGKSNEDYNNALLMLAKNYCQQQKMAKFAKLIFNNDLKYYCKYNIK